MQRFMKLTWGETKLFLREPGAYIGLAFPFVLLFVFGSIYGNTPSAFLGGRGGVDAYMPAYIALLIVANGFYSLPLAIVNYRERGVLFRLQATPLRPLNILSAQVGANFLMTTAGTVILIVIASIFYHLHVTSTIVNVVIAYLLGVLSIFALGFLVGSIVPNARVAAVLGTVLFLPMLYLSGATVPLKLYPQVVQQIAQFLPLTHVITLLSALWFGESWGAHWLNVLALFGLMIVCLLASTKLFRWR
jgi:ABC-2 type transport system permease protein